MLDWMTNDDAPAVLVTVAAVTGSAPRDAGAKMLVLPQRQSGTIGGGHLEQRACEIARAMLADAAAPAPRAAASQLQRFALGPSLGQCCGGVVHLAFELIGDGPRTQFDALQQRWRQRQDSWRVVSLGAAQPDAPPTMPNAPNAPNACDAPDTASALFDDGGQLLLADGPHLPPRFERQRGCHVLQDDSGRRWLIDPCLPSRNHVFLFGAGHVGAALVQALAPLPCHVTWIDQRAALFPATVPEHVRIEISDTPEALVDTAPAGTYFLVMTHSHALDQQLAEAILQRDDSAWFGLIGSHTKRQQFEHRLRARGFAPRQLAHMTCPIGIAGITGKAPAVVAASVCAQLLQLWQEL
jgi:xanthine dehydrogenase accessory factor